MSRRADWVALFLALAAGVALGSLQEAGRKRGTPDAFTQAVQGLAAGPAGAFRAEVAVWQARADAFRGASGRVAELERLREVERSASAYLERVRFLAEENARLRAQLGAPDFGRNPLPCRVAGVAPYAQRITLDRGADDGVAPGMPVVNGSGLLAIVESVGPGTSQALLLTSASCTFGGLTTGAKPVAGLVRGYTPGRLVVELLEPGEVTPGEGLVTSGFSAAIPRGIPVGVVLEVRNDPGLGIRQAVVLPAARLGESSVVAVLR